MFVRGDSVTRTREELTHHEGVTKTKNYRGHDVQMATKMTYIRYLLHVGRRQCAGGETDRVVRHALKLIMWSHSMPLIHRYE